MGYKFEAKLSEASKKAHPDYGINLEMAKRNFPRIHEHMPLGMNVEFGLDEFRKECFVMVSFTPPRFAPISRMACVVELHQPYELLKTEMNAIYNNYVKFAKHFWENYIISEIGDTVINYKTGVIKELKPI